jgi:hypothetical protein
MTLYNDPNVMFAGEKVGGIRISHLSHIPKTLEMSLMASKKKKTVYKMLVLEPPKVEPPKPEPVPQINIAVAIKQVRVAIQRNDAAAAATYLSTLDEHHQQVIFKNLTNKEYDTVIAAWPDGEIIE